MVEPLRHRQTKGAANRYARPTAAAPHSNSTNSSRPAGANSGHSPTAWGRVADVRFNPGLSWDETFMCTNVPGRSGGTDAPFWAVILNIGVRFSELTLHPIRRSWTCGGR